MAFTFNTSNAGDGGGASNNAPAPTGTGFSFGADNAAPAPATGAGFSFGAATSEGAAAAVSTFGAPPAGTAAAPAPSRFSFGAAPTTGTSDTTDSKDASTTAPAPAATGFSFGASPAPAADSSNAPAPGAAFPSFGGGGAPVPPAAGAASTDSSTGGNAQGGFSFGGPSGGDDNNKHPAASFGSTTPAPAPSDSNKKQAPSPAAESAAGTFTGFSFGANTGTPASGGFDFGGGTTPSKDVASTPTVATPVAPAPVDTPGSVSGSAPGTSSALVAPASVQKEPAGIEYQTLTVEQILNNFQKQLEEDSLAFVEEAKRVCEYDAVLRDGKRDLSKLTTEAQRLVAEQERTEQQVQGIGTFQDQIEKTLNQVEEQIDLIFQNQSHLVPQDADRERELAYSTAKAIDDRLDDITASLSSTFDRLSVANSQAFGSQTAEILEILNKHEDSLNDLEAMAQKLDVDCNEVTRMLQGARQ